MCCSLSRLRLLRGLRALPRGDGVLDEDCKELTERPAIRRSQRANGLRNFGLRSEIEKRL
jgi:hypothetical protein